MRIKVTRMDILNTNPSTLLEQFQNAYFDQIGSRMTIGSEEYTLSSIFTYVLSMYAGLINNSYDNQNLDTASGIFLDNIAARYNLNRTPEVYSNPWFEGYFKFDKNSPYYNRPFDPKMVTIVVDGHEYYNDSVIVQTTDQQPIRWVSTQPHQDYLSSYELHKTLENAKDLDGNKVFDLEPYFSTYLTNLNSVTRVLDDEAFRDYIKRSKQLYIPGIAGSFEALAKNCSDNVVDARCRVQTDKGFIKGNVDLYCKFYSYNEHHDYWSYIKQLETQYIKKAIESKNLIVIGQTLHVMPANRVADSRQYTFYVSKVYNTQNYKQLLYLKFRSVMGYLNNKGLKIGEDYYPTKLITMMQRPLSEISTNPKDFGWLETDYAYVEFSKYESLPVIGLSSVSSMMKKSCDATTSVYLDSTNSVYFEFID